MKINKNIIQRYGLSESDLNFVQNSFVPENVPTNGFSLKEGNISNKIGFVKTGLLRPFFYDDGANGITTQFFPSGSLIISSDSFNNQVSSKENIIAVADSELSVISYTKMKELYQIVPLWQGYCRQKKR